MLPAVLTDIKVIDTDTHVIEPYDLWTSRISVSKWGDKVPHMKWDPDAEEEAWYFGDRRICSGASEAMAGWPEYCPDRPRRMADVDPATWDAGPRLKKMDEYGIHAQILYPNVSGFGAGRFLGMNDSELSLLCVRAYNDYLTDFCSADTARFIPMTALPFWDLEASAREMERCASNGHRGILMTSQPEAFGLPHITDRHWDRLWAAAQDRSLPVNFHIASGDTHADLAAIPQIEETGRHATFASMQLPFFLGNARAISNLICSGVCHRFPTLNFVSVESGVGWLPYALDSLDWSWKNNGVIQEHPEYDLLPSEYFKRQMYGAFWFETDTVKSTLEALGPDNILYETDFPHPTSMSPGPASVAERPGSFIENHFSDLPSDVVQKIFHDNAARIYHLP
jgi:predicted TIM-barrel fold metal-dependent hydrolase